jgi:hypothetical protein
MYDSIYTQKYTKHYKNFHAYLWNFITTYISFDKLNLINLSLIKNACWRKAKPRRATRPAIGARTHAGPRSDGGRQAAEAAQHTGPAGRLVWFGIVGGQKIGWSPQTQYSWTNARKLQEGRGQVIPESLYSLQKLWIPLHVPSRPLL